MGFGLIFLGWLTLFGLKTFPVGIIGCILMLCGLTKLTSYSKNFIKAKKLCIVFLVYFTVFGVLWSLYMTNIFDFTKNTFIKK